MRLFTVKLRHYGDAISRAKSHSDSINHNMLLKKYERNHKIRNSIITFIFALVKFLKGKKNQGNANLILSHEQKIYPFQLKNLFSEIFSNPS